MNERLTRNKQGTHRVKQKMDFHKYGKAIRENRKIRNMTQLDLAKLAGIDIKCLSGLENGIHKPRPSTRAKIEKALMDHPVSELIRSIES